MSVVKPNPKWLLWPIKKNGDNLVNQSKLEVITRSRRLFPFRKRSLQFETVDAIF